MFILIITFGLFVLCSFNNSFAKEKTDKENKKDYVCYDCHAPKGMMSIFGFDNIMRYVASIGGHPEIDTSMDIKTGCAVECHSNDFVEKLHEAHLVVPEGGYNNFVVMTGGDCTYCHKVQFDGSIIVPGLSD
jgi:hypothetical protein